MIRFVASTFALALVIGCGGQTTDDRDYADDNDGYEQDENRSDDYAPRGDDTENIEPDNDTGPWDGYPGESIEGTGWIKGQVGPMTGLNDEVALNGYAESGYAWIEVLADKEEGAAMHGIDIWGGLDHPALTDGAKLVFGGADSSWDLDEGELFMNVWACAGATPYNWDYDHTADEVVVDVADGDEPGTLVLTYKISVVDYDDNVTNSAGSIVVARD